MCKLRLTVSHGLRKCPGRAGRPDAAQSVRAPARWAPCGQRPGGGLASLPAGGPADFYGFQGARPGRPTPLWGPPPRLVVVSQVNAQWKPDAAMKSEVDVRFSADGPDATQVELLHQKFETMGAEAGASMRKDVDGGWPGLTERFARESA